MKISKLRTANKIRQAEVPGGDTIDLGFRVLELAGETGELLNLLKKMTRIERGIKMTKESDAELKIMMADELADVLICTDLLGMDVGFFLNDILSESDFSPRQRSLMSSKVGLGNMLIGQVGRVCENVCYSTDAYDTSRLGGHASEIVFLVRKIAEDCKIDIELAVTMKFNATSAKHGFKTRIT